MVRHSCRLHTILILNKLDNQSVSKLHPYFNVLLLYLPFYQFFILIPFPLYHIFFLMGTSIYSICFNSTAKHNTIVPIQNSTLLFPEIPFFSFIPNHFYFFLIHSIYIILVLQIGYFLWMVNI